jgi:hypothetical protein
MACFRRHGALCAMRLCISRAARLEPSALRAAKPAETTQTRAFATARNLRCAEVARVCFALRWRGPPARNSISCFGQCTAVASAALAHSSWLCAVAKGLQGSLTGRARFAAKQWRPGCARAGHSVNYKPYAFRTSQLRSAPRAAVSGRAQTCEETNRGE